MKIILDFDDVIFNTRRFNHDYRRAFFVRGIPENVFNDCYHQLSTSGRPGRKLYDPQKHFKALGCQLVIEERKLKEILNKFIKTADKYLFPDAINFLKKFKKKDLYLVSYGKKGYQDLKISRARVKKYFKKVAILDGAKSRAVAQIIKSEKIGKDEQIFFLDDRADWVGDVKKRYPRVITFLVKRREGRYDDKKNKHCDFEVKNLKEAAKIIENLEKIKGGGENLCAE